jgi:hypothetical protein
MAKRGIGIAAILVLGTGSLSRADEPIPFSAPPTGVITAVQPSQPVKEKTKAQPVPAIPSASVNGAANGLLNGLPNASRAALADAFISQNVLRVYLDRPAAVTVYNSRGQQVAHLDSRRAMEAVPLQGISTGFIYLTVRTAQGELTKKLVYTGK